MFLNPYPAGAATCPGTVTQAFLPSSVSPCPRQDKSWMHSPAVARGVPVLVVAIVREPMRLYTESAEHHAIPGRKAGPFTGNVSAWPSWAHGVRGSARASSTPPLSKAWGAPKAQPNAREAPACAHPKTSPASAKFRAGPQISVRRVSRPGPVQASVCSGSRGSLRALVPSTSSWAMLCSLRLLVLEARTRKAKARSSVAVLQQGQFIDLRVGDRTCDPVLAVQRGDADQVECRQPLWRQLPGHGSPQLGLAKRASSEQAPERGR
jgi:hypothetical protein